MTNVISGAYEVCDSFRAPIEHDELVCAGCGHLADDHDVARAATVSPLRSRRPVVSRPTRKAS